MNAKLIKPIAAELLDEQMRLMPCALNYYEFELLLNSCRNKNRVFDEWQFFCGRMFLDECGLNPNRN